MVGYRQTNQKTDTGKTLTRWPVFVDHFIEMIQVLWQEDQVDLAVELALDVLMLPKE